MIGSHITHSIVYHNMIRAFYRTIETIRAPQRTESGRPPNLQIDESVAADWIAAGFPRKKAQAVSGTNTGTTINPRNYRNRISVPLQGRDDARALDSKRDQSSQVAQRARESLSVYHLIPFCYTPPICFSRQDSFLIYFNTLLSLITIYPSFINYQRQNSPHF